MNHKTRWTAEKIARRLNLIKPLAYRRSQALPEFRHLPLSGPEAEPPTAPEIEDQDWPLIPAESYWGEWQRDFILRTTFTIPKDWPVDGPTALYLPLGQAGDFSHPEALVYIDGRPLAACDRHHQEIYLPGDLRDGRLHHLALHGWTGLGGWWVEDPKTQLFMKTCAVVQIDQPTRDLVAAARVALGTVGQLGENDPARWHLLSALDRAFQILDLREPLAASFYSSVPPALAALREGIAQAGPPLDVAVIAAGHAHIDVAWLWTVAQTRRKAGRTFHTVTHLMDQFPDYHFTQSQPQIYDYLHEDYPELFAAIQERVAQGRWEPIGGMWVEADCNISGAEALARQFLLGRSYFRQHFGPTAESPVLWLPDVFGYAWNLPQLFKEAGLDYFFTIKISWNQYNRMPYDSFWWQGLDGTKVLTHFSPTLDEWSLTKKEGRRPTTYNAQASPLEVLSTWTNLQQKESQQVMLMAFGFGDGGGGPTAEMLENIREMADFPALPRVKNGRVLDFFRKLEKTAGAKLPTWNGELYLEYHRGTYTTQARNKRSNRQCEFLLHDAEFLAAWAAQVSAYSYPQEPLTRAWKLLCLNQFHDILPGSSINQVYQDSAADYAAIREIGEGIKETAVSALAQQLPQNSHYAAINPTSFSGPQTGLLPEALPFGQSLINLQSGAVISSQAVEEGTLLHLPHIAPFGLVSLGLAAGEPPSLSGSLAIQKTAGGVELENDYLRVVFDSRGELISLTDKAHNRQVLAEDQRGNIFQAFEDRPLDWDAWDIDLYYEDKMWMAEPAHHLAIIEEGPLRAGLEIQRRLGRSTIRQRIYLHRFARRLDFDTTVDWQEKHTLLKVAFPVNILSPAATFDVQWGNVQRPTHRNTSWDWARFETCAHKWVDLSEGDYGVSLLNDCKYGHDIQDHVIRLTLLRSPTMPDPLADQGEQRFLYSLLPHSGDWRSSTVRDAYILNDPLIVRRAPGGGGKLEPSLVAVDQENVIIETVKQAEDSRGLILRLYENARRRGPVSLSVGLPISAAYRCNLLEENKFALPVKNNQVHFEIKPYQILTIRLELA